MSEMDVLIVGSGAREHALAWKLRQSPDVGRLLVAPGNAGTALLAENVPIAAGDIEGIVRLAEERDVALTVVGPEAPLALGLADRLRAAGRRVVGPDRAAARIESSKAFGKTLMMRAGVPTALAAVFDDPSAALRYAARHEYPLVVKADGLAAGKGVWICRDEAEARQAIEAMMVRDVYGVAGRRVVIEEALAGPEVSLIALVDGERVIPFPLAQDHKRLGDGDTGPNTGGMGAYAPVPFLDAAERDALTRLVMEPVVAELAAAGIPYRGFLFAGLMLTETGPRVLEYNCRLGDPEAQVILPLLEDDLLPWLEAVAGGRLPEQFTTTEGSAVGVVLAAPGYPEKPRTGTPIEGLDRLPAGVLAFHAGTRRDEQGRVVTNGGRAITLVGLGQTIDEAAERAYGAPVRFEGMQRRSDIAWQARLPHIPEPSSPPVEQPVGKRCPRIGVLASGEGSNLQALLDACRRGEVDAEIAVVVSHRAGAGALRRAHEAGIPAYALPLTDRHDPTARHRLEEDLLGILLSCDLDLLVLAGWMLILSPAFLARCPIPILNVHPALLPDGGESLDVPILRGAHAVREALALGLPYTGVSVHHVTEEVDAGPVVMREVVSIEPGDDEESLYRRIKGVEHRLLARAVQTVLSQTLVGGVHA